MRSTFFEKKSSQSICRGIIIFHITFINTPISRITGLDKFLSEDELLKPLSNINMNNSRKVILNKDSDFKSINERKTLNL